MRDRFSHKSAGLIHSLPRPAVVAVVETQESLRAGRAALFISRSLPIMVINVSGTPTLTRPRRQRQGEMDREKPRVNRREKEGI